MRRSPLLGMNTWQGVSTENLNIMYLDPSGMPTDLGEKNLLLINAMESALQEGHHRQYQIMMKQYFRNLQKVETSTNE